MLNEINVTPRHDEWTLSKLVVSEYAGTYYEIHCMPTRQYDEKGEGAHTNAILYLFPVRSSCVVSPCSFAFPE